MHYRVLVLSAVLLVCAQPAPAQQQQPQQGQEQLKPGNSLKLGLVLSRFTGTDLKTAPAPGFTLGLSLDFPLAERFSVRAEANYIEKGSRVTDEILNTEFDLTMDYIEVPLLAMYRFPMEGKMTPHLFAGPYTAFLIENNSNSELMNDQRYTPDNLVDDAVTVDFGVVAGAGTEFDFKFNRMTVEIRYHMGITGAFDSDAPGTIRNGAAALLIGFGL